MYVDCNILQLEILQILFWLSVEWSFLGERLISLCNTLPHNYHLNIDKLKAIPKLLDVGGEQLHKLIISSSADVKKINQKVVTYLILKLCYHGSSTNLVGLCDVMDEVIHCTDAPTCAQNLRYGMPKLCT